MKLLAFEMRWLLAIPDALLPSGAHERLAAGADTAPMAAFFDGALARSPMRPILGLGATGDRLGVDVGLEATALLEDSSPPLVLGSRMPTPDQVESAASVVLGVGRRFENTLDLHAEYFFNGGGDNDDLATSLARVSGGTLLAAVI